MDGVIFDTEPFYKLAWQAAASELGFGLTDSFYDGFYGVNTATCEAMLKEHFGDGFPMPQFRSRRDELFAAVVNSRPIPLKAGFREMLAFLESRALPLAIATSSPMANVRTFFRDTDYLSSFQHITTADVVSVSKPAPDIYQHTIKKLNIPAERVIVIEDSLNGVRAGWAAGTNVVMIPDVIQPTPDIRKMCTLIVDNLSELIDHPILFHS
jgi:beta-phosphoglucomutase-like phosphatase (HAD superfamily)